MDGKFSFQVLREKDRLLYSAADVKRAITVKKKKPGVQRVSKRPGFFKPAPSEARAPNARPGLEFTEITYIQEQCDHLYAEVLALEAEVAPLRRRRDELEEGLLERDRQEVRYNQAYHPEERQISWARVRHRNTKELLGARKERDMIAEEKKKLQQVIEDDNVDGLKEAVERQRKTILDMRRSARQKELEIAHVRFQIKEIASSALFEDVQKQREEIVELRARLAGEVEINKGLKAKMEKIEGQNFYLSEDEIENTKEVQGLNRKLESALRKKKDAARRLRELNREHNDEEVTQMAMNREKKRKLRTIFAGLFEDEVTEDGMHTMFDQFGKIESVALGMREHKGSKYHCASIQYKTHDQAKLAIKSMNKISFRNKPMMVLWNDESPTPPAEGSRPSSVRREKRVSEPQDESVSNPRTGRWKKEKEKERSPRRHHEYSDEESNVTRRDVKSPLEVQMVNELDIVWTETDTESSQKHKSRPRRRVKQAHEEQDKKSEAVTERNAERNDEKGQMSDVIKSTLSAMQPEGGKPELRPPTDAVGQSSSNARFKRIVKKEQKEKPQTEEEEKPTNEIASSSSSSTVDVVEDVINTNTEVVSSDSEKADESASASSSDHIKPEAEHADSDVEVEVVSSSSSSKADKPKENASRTASDDQKAQSEHKNDEEDDSARKKQDQGAEDETEIKTSLNEKLPLLEVQIHENGDHDEVKSKPSPTLEPLEVHNAETKERSINNLELPELKLEATKNKDKSDHENEQKEALTLGKSEHGSETGRNAEAQHTSSSSSDSEHNDKADDEKKEEDKKSLSSASEKDSGKRDADEVKKASESSSSTEDKVEKVDSGQGCEVEVLSSTSSSQKSVKQANEIHESGKKESSSSKSSSSDKGPAKEDKNSETEKQEMLPDKGAVISHDKSSSSSSSTSKQLEKEDNDKENGDADESKANPSTSLPEKIPQQQSSEPENKEALKTRSLVETETPEAIEGAKHEESAKNRDNGETKSSRSESSSSQPQPIHTANNVEQGDEKESLASSSRDEVCNEREGTPSAQKKSPNKEKEDSVASPATEEAPQKESDHHGSENKEEVKQKRSSSSPSSEPEKVSTKEESGHHDGSRERTSSSSSSDSEMEPSRKESTRKVTSSSSSSSEPEKVPTEHESEHHDSDGKKAESKAKTSSSSSSESEKVSAKGGSEHHDSNNKASSNGKTSSSSSSESEKEKKQESDHKEENTRMDNSSSSSSSETEKESAKGGSQRHESEKQGEDKPVPLPSSRLEETRDTAETERKGEVETKISSASPSDAEKAPLKVTSEPKDEAKVDEDEAVAKASAKGESDHREAEVNNDENPTVRSAAPAADEIPNHAEDEMKDDKKTSTSSFSSSSEPESVSEKAESQHENGEQKEREESLASQGESQRKSPTSKSDNPEGEHKEEAQNSSSSSSTLEKRNATEHGQVKEKTSSADENGHRQAPDARNEEHNEQGRSAPPPVTDPVAQPNIEINDKETGSEVKGKDDIKEGDLKVDIASSSSSSEAPKKASEPEKIESKQTNSGMKSSDYNESPANTNSSPSDIVVPPNRKQTSPSSSFASDNEKEEPKEAHEGPIMDVATTLVTALEAQPAPKTESGSQKAKAITNSDRELSFESDSREQIQPAKAEQENIDDDIKAILASD